jgi:hypothetical protein
MPGRHACEQVIQLILHPKFSRRRLAADLDEVVGLNNVLAKELAVLRAMNTKIRFKCLPDPARNR